MFRGTLLWGWPGLTSNPERKTSRGIVVGAHDDLGLQWGLAVIARSHVGCLCVSLLTSIAAANCSAAADVFTFVGAML